MKTKSFWLPAFRMFIPAGFEAWMEQLASEGWNIDKLKTFSVFRMTFRKTEPKRYRYVYDMHFRVRMYKDYMQTYEQFGWEYVGRLNANTFLWRREYTDERPESFTDSESLIKRNMRVRNAVIAVFAMMLVSILAMLTGIAVCALSGETEAILPLACVAALIAPLSLYLYWIIRKISAGLES
jgi:hypothetical protein